MNRICVLILDGDLIRGAGAGLGTGNASHLETRCCDEQ